MTPPLTKEQLQVNNQGFVKLGFNFVSLDRFTDSLRDEYPDFEVIDKSAANLYINITIGGGDIPVSGGLVLVDHE